MLPHVAAPENAHACLPTQISLVENAMQKGEKHMKNTGHKNASSSPNHWDRVCEVKYLGSVACNAHCHQMATQKPPRSRPPSRLSADTREKRQNATARDEFHHDSC